MAGVSLQNVVKAYGEATVIPDLDLEVADREFVVLVGPSGCGKTTTLRMIAGLESVSGGEVRIGEREVTHLRPGLRNCSMVFQNYALYPHMSVRQNIGYGMKVRGVAKVEVERNVQEAARILGLEPLLDRRPKHLSGGQRQRVAIGRAIVRHPDVFLFDEPLSNLDAKLRVEMRTEIKALHRRLATTMVYVTHDQVEAMTMADRVVVMNQGRIVQAADPITLYERPADLFVAGFIGAPSMNMLGGEVVQNGAGGLTFQAETGDALDLPTSRTNAYAEAIGKPAVLGIRPEHALPNGAQAGNTVRVAVTAVEPLGPHTLIVGQAGGEGASVPFTAQLPSHTKARAEETIEVPLDLERCHLFERETGRAV